MGNNVLPARAGEALRVVLLDGRTDAGKRKILGTIVAERLLDLVALVIIFVLTVYLVLEGDVVPDRRAAADRRHRLRGARARRRVVLWMVHRRGGLQRLRELARPLAARAARAAQPPGRRCCWS